MPNSVETKKWCDTIKQLPSVMSVEIMRGEDGAPTEVHILADNRRQAKQISRDIQSALAAKYGLTIDHKIISVAQIRSNEPQPQNRILYLGFEYSHSSGGYLITVRLLHEGVTYEGHSTGATSVSEKPAAIARAAADALCQILGSRGTMSIEDVQTVELSGEYVVMVSVKFAALRRPTEKLVGCCYTRGDSEVAVIRATLDAVNRRFEVL